MQTKINLLIFLVLMGAVVVRSQETVLVLPQDTDVFFKKFSYTASKYLHFRTNGTYRIIDCQHVGVSEYDFGTWNQDKAGEIVLVSQKHYRDIRSGPMEVSMRHTQAMNRLAPLSLSISNLLARNPAPVFSSQEIQGIEKYGDENENSRIKVYGAVETISRAQLTTLIADIGEFIKDPKKRHFHLAPMQYKKITFLHWKDSETPINRNLDEIKGLIDKRKDSTLPPFIFLQIDRKTFESESGKTQEFLFRHHPQAVPIWLCFLLGMIGVWFCVRWRRKKRCDENSTPG